MKTFKHLFFTMIAILIISGCEKDYYNPNDIQFSISIEDTVSLSTPIKIKVNLNEPLKTRLYFDAMSEKALIETLAPSVDSFLWDSSEAHLSPGNSYSFYGRISFKSGKSKEHSIWTSKTVFVKE